MDPFEQCQLLEDFDDDLIQCLNFSDTDFNIPSPVAPSEPPVPLPSCELMSELSANFEEPYFGDFSVDEVPKIEVPPLIDEIGVGDIRQETMNQIVLASPAWIPGFLDCSCCHLLREVVHTNGIRSMKLALHGGPGSFFHATLDNYIDAEGFPSSVEQFYIDLSTQSFSWVKQFLLDYGLLRTEERYEIVQDSLPEFYDALCVPMICEQSQDCIMADQQMLKSGLHGGMQIEADRVNAPKNKIATQRERTKNLELKDLANYFHLPINQAAKELDFCPTALKKVCRKYGIPRWPHRKIRSLDRTIENLEMELKRAGTVEGAMRMASEIERLRSLRASICAGLIK